MSPHSRQCTSCSYTESPTANTLFHQVKFDLLKAFYIVYFVSTNKKGITSTEFSRKLSLRQKTCRVFKRKVMKAMKSSGSHPINGEAEVDQTIFGGQEEGVRGRKNKNKKLVVIGIEKKKKGVSRMYAKIIPEARSVSLGGFMRHHISPSAKVKTDLWTGYGPLEKDFENLVRIPSGKKGANFPEIQGHNEPKRMASRDAPLCMVFTGLFGRILLQVQSEFYERKDLRQPNGENGKCPALLYKKPQ